MTEERITTTETPDGSTHTTHTTVISEEGKGNGGKTWLIVLVVLVAIGLGVWFFSEMGTSEVARDNAIAEAAREVGEAANQVGAAAEQAGDAAENVANEVTGDE